MKEARSEHIKINDPKSELHWLTSIEEDSFNGPREIALLTKQFSSERKIFISGEITSESALSFVSQMMYLAKAKKPVSIYINSPGGSVNAGLILYDCIQAFSEKGIEVNLYCVGIAASMSAILLASGPKGHRYILPHSKVMIHEPILQDGLCGSASSIKKTADYILETRSITNGLLSKHTGKTIEEVDEACSYDHYMTAEESIEFGICDEIRNLF